MVTVKQLIDRLRQFDEDSVVRINAYNGDGSAEAEVYVNNYMIADLVDYYNSDELELT